MKTTLLLACLLSVALMGCASTPGVVVQPVGPSQPKAGPAAEGSLIVYSAFDSHASGPNDPDYRRFYTPYVLLASDGSVLREVSNRAGPTGESPSVVTLPSGQYLVKAAANGFP